jgi:glycosyltransferase involved in cell wall biosynthesis
MTNWGGVERMLLDLLTGKKTSTISHLLLTPSAQTEILEPVVTGNVPFHRMERASRFDPAAIRRAARWIRQEGITIIHAYNAFANIWGRILSTLTGTPFITGEHGTVWQTQGTLMVFDRFSQRTANMIIANSVASALMLHLRYRLPLEQICVIPNGVAPLPPTDIVVKRASLRINEPFLVGSVGRLDTPKHFTTLIDAARHLLTVRQDVHFVLIGGGPLEEELRAYVINASLEPYFTLLGWRDDARELIQCFDIFISTSIRESSGNALVEAGLAAVPVIAPAVDGIPEVVAHDVNGILLNPTQAAQRPRTAAATPLHPYSLIKDELSSPLALDPQLLARTIDQLLENSEWRLRLGMAGQVRARHSYSLNHYRLELEALYTQINGQGTLDSGSPT